MGGIPLYRMKVAAELIARHLNNSRGGLEDGIFDEDEILSNPSITVARALHMSDDIKAMAVFLALLDIVENY